MEQGDGAEIRKYCLVATDASCGAKWCDGRDVGLHGHEHHRASESRGQRTKISKVFVIPRQNP